MTEILTLDQARHQSPAERQPYAPDTFLLCTPSQWGSILLTGLLVSGAAWPWYGQISPWLGMVVFLLSAVFMHLVFTSGQIVPLPHVAIFIAGLQYVLAAWMSFYYPPTNSSYDIGARLPVYLEFASLVVAAVVLGWAVALWGIRQLPIRAMSASPALLLELDGLFWFGIVCQLAGRFVSLGGLGFVLLLCANLRYVGALGRMLVSGPGWLWRVVLTLVLESLLATQSGMFHSLLLWTTGVFALYLYHHRPNKATVIGLVMLGFLLLPAFQLAKYNLRGKTWDTALDSPGAGLAGAANLGNGVEFLKDLRDGLVKSVTLNWDPEFLGDTGARYNQGWIVNKIMEQVPSLEPCARGETLLDAVKAAVLPRILAPNKHTAGGQEYMNRFAGINLIGTTTSMNLGYAGEMYANFGYWGGIAGCFGYALLLGLAYRLVSVWAANRPLWWVFVVYIGLAALKAEEGIAETLNWLVKASVVTAAIYFTFPALRAALSGTQSQNQPQGRTGSRSGTATVSVSASESVLEREVQALSARNPRYWLGRAEQARLRLEAVRQRNGLSLPPAAADPTVPGLPLTFNHVHAIRAQNQNQNRTQTQSQPQAPVQAQMAMQSNGLKWQRRRAERAASRRQKLEGR